MHIADIVTEIQTKSDCRYIDSGLRVPLVVLLISSSTEATRLFNYTCVTKMAMERP